MNSLRKTLVGILTITLLAGVTAHIARANPDPPAQDFLTGKWEGVQRSFWLGDFKCTLQYDTGTRNITGSGTVVWVAQTKRARTMITGELKNDRNVRLNVHYERFGAIYDIMYDLTYENGTLVGSGLNPRGVNVTLELKKVD